MDPIIAMMQPPTDEEQQRLMAEALRGRKQAADFFAYSTVPEIQKQAASEQANVMKAAETSGVLKRAMEERLSEEKMAEERNKAMLRQAELYAGGRNQGDSELSEESSELVNELSTLVQLGSQWKPEYGPDTPLLGDLENMLATNFENLPFLSEEKKQLYREKANWWRNYKRLSELEVRHKMFGSALTASEAKEWQKATITPNTIPSQVQEHFKTRLKLARKVLEYEAAQKLADGVPLERVQEKYRGLVNIENIYKNGGPSYYLAQMQKNTEEKMRLLMGEQLNQSGRQHGGPNPNINYTHEDADSVPSLSSQTTASAADWTAEDEERLQKLKAEKAAGG